MQASLKLFPIYEASGEVPRIADPLFTVGYGLASSAKSEEGGEGMKQEARLA
jgi:hypothetical protein